MEKEIETGQVYEVPELSELGDYDELTRESASRWPTSSFTSTDPRTGFLSD